MEIESIYLILGIVGSRWNGRERRKEEQEMSDERFMGNDKIS